MQTRTEVDLLGEREVPAEVYWGIHTLRAIENFQISGTRLESYPHFIIAMVQVKKAVARANRRLKVLPEDKAHAIEAACDKILGSEDFYDQWPLDLFQGGAGTSVNMNTNEVIANVALEMLGFEKGRYDIIHPNDDVNKSQSTNDSYPTGFHLAVYRELVDLRLSASRLMDALDEKAHEFADVLKMGRTHLQDAVPMTLGQEFEAFTVSLREELRVIDQAADLLLSINLGATAIGTGLNTPEGYPQVAVEELSKVTGLPFRRAANLIDATSDTGAFVSVHGALKRFAVKLSKICNDLRLLSSGPTAGLQEINLPPMQAGSSIMPAKVNPVIPEVVNQVCFKVVGNDMTVTMAAEAAQLQLNVMEPVIAQVLFESMRLLENATVTLAERCITGITANREHLHEQVMGSIGIVTYFNELIGHQNGDMIGKEAARTGRRVSDLIVERGLLPREEVEAILTAQNLVSPEYEGKIWEAGERGLPTDAKDLSS